MGNQPERVQRAVRRSGMAGKLDARVVRTRKALAEAVREALNRDPGTSPTVATVCSLAGVTPSTFYSHFASTDDLIVSEVSETIQRISDSDVTRRENDLTSPIESTLIVIREILAEVRQQPELFDWALSMAGGQTSRLISDNVTEQTRVSLRTIRSAPTDLDVDLTAEFLAGGVLNVIRLAAKSPGNSSLDDRLAAQLVGLFPAWIGGPPEPRESH